MAMIGWFPLSKFGPGTEVTFQTPSSSVWKVREKLSQHNRQREEFDPQDPEDCPSSAEATFYVQDSQSNLDGAIAYMRVYMQVPVLTTEFEPREVRRRQATCCSHNEVAALKYFHEEGATMTPALLGIKEEVQDDDGVVPGGYIVYMVFQRVSGIKLAESQAAPCPEFPLHTFFRRFERAERDKIREEFAKSYCPLARLNWMPIEPWADHLIWDSASEKLWFIDFRMAMEASWPKRSALGPHKKNDWTDADLAPMCQIWKYWGLAVPPVSRKHLGELSAWQL